MLSNEIRNDVNDSQHNIKGGLGPLFVGIFSLELYLHGYIVDWMISVDDGMISQ